jgi:hypothetical protein
MCGVGRSSYTSFPDPVINRFNQRIPLPQINQNAQHVERHVATGTYPHFGENRRPENVQRPRVNRHSFTSTTYPRVMASIRRVDTPLPQANRNPNSRMAIATLSRAIPTTEITYLNNRPHVINSGYTRHIGLYGDGDQGGFDRVRTIFPRPPSPQPISSTIRRWLSNLSCDLC